MQKLTTRGAIWDSLIALTPGLRGGLRTARRAIPGESCRPSQADAADTAATQLNGLLERARVEREREQRIGNRTKGATDLALWQRINRPVDYLLN